MTKKKIKKISKNSDARLREEVEVVDVIVILAIIAIYIIMILNADTLLNQAEEHLGISNGGGLFFTSFILELVPQLFDPGFGVFVAMASGMSLMAATIIIIMGSLAASVLGFEIGRKYGLRIISKLFSEKALSKILAFFKKYGKYVVLFGAMTPFPYSPIIFGALNLSRREFLFFGLIPRILNFTLFSLAIHYGLVFINWFY